MSETWKVIVSSMSGGGKAGQEWPEIAARLEARGIAYSISYTKYRFHAKEIAIEALKEGFRRIIVVGGDGALHEVLSGIMSQSEVPSNMITIAIIPVGSGNDWARLHEIPNGYDDVTDVIARGKTVLQDVGKVESFMNGEPFISYMVNIGGLGFDAQVCHDFDKNKKEGKATSDALYFKCLLKGFMGHSARKFRIVTDGTLFYDGLVFSVAMGIGKYSGGGMLQTPGAVFDDGLIDLTVIKKISKFNIMLKIPCLFKGNIYNMKEVLHTRARVIEISAEPESFVEVDGETVGISPIRVEVIPAAIRVITNL
ncbi:MAG: diacylglycerol kinase family lipid kinase [Bacteroidales bacterium]|nr:diacylglycerol kinase family lipid kinase [Bacteroidales bacterium]